MAVVKDKVAGTWYVQVRYDDWQGKRQRRKKRGFATKRDAQAWERNFLQKQTDDLDMAFGQFIKLYEEDRRPRLRENTWLTKEHIIEKKLMPYFGDTPMNEIDAKSIIRWQNTLIGKTDENGKTYSATYLKSIHNQLTAIFTHAYKYYGLKNNPASKVGSMGKKNADEMKFWTREEYAAFSKAAMREARFYYPYEVLYWCGLRLGEMLALTYGDIDFERQTIRVNKSFQSIHGEPVVTEPKTAKSKRVVAMPANLASEMREYMAIQRSYELDERMFHVSKSSMNNRLKRFAAEAEVKPIRVHDLRHSHVSLLIELGFSAVAIADRVGHESIEITYRYAHLFPTRQADMANSLDCQMEAMRHAS
jgi:integrase